PEPPAPLSTALSTLGPPATSETRQQRLESLWRGWEPGQPLPRWQEFLPAPGQRSTPDAVLLLLQTDIEFRVKAGPPARLAEPYFQHERLQGEDARLSAAQQQELIRWEYQQRWKRGERAARRDYLGRFAEHAAALRDLVPRWN